MKFLIVLFILSELQNISGEIPSVKTTPATNSEVIAKAKMVPNKKELIQPTATAAAAAVSAISVPITAKERSLPAPAELKVYDDAALRKNISDLNKRQIQQEVYLKQILENLSYIKKSVIKIVNQNTDWVTIQRRQDGSVDFYRTWDEYKEGFGNSLGEFFIGLDNLHEMTGEGNQELLIVLEDFEHKTRYAKYNKFVVGGEDEKYAIMELGDYNGDAGDSLRYHRSRKFSTKDQDNDNNPTANCAKDYKSGWWFDNCYSSNLNGPYLKGARSCRGGINWYHWHNYVYSLKSVEMMIRELPPEE